MFINCYYFLTIFHELINLRILNVNKSDKKFPIIRIFSRHFYQNKLLNAIWNFILTTGLVFAGIRLAPRWIIFIQF